MEYKKSLEERKQGILNNLTILEFLQFEGVQITNKGNKNFINCLYHNDKNPSCIVGDIIVKCFSCNTKANLFDLCMQLKGLDIVEAVEHLEKIIGQEVEQSPAKQRNLYKEYQENQKQRQAEARQKFLNIYSMLKNPTKTIGQHLKNRGIFDIANQFNRDKQSNFRIKEAYFDNSVWITYVFNNSFLIQKPITNIFDKEGNKKSPRTTGGATPFYFGVNNKNIIAICEGVEDALTVAGQGVNSITLNSLTNINKLFKAIENNLSKYQDKTFLLYLDLDKAGIEAREKIKVFLKDKNIKYKSYKEETEKFMLNTNIKDINDYYRIKKLIERQEQEEHLKESYLVVKTIQNYMKNNNCCFEEVTPKYFEELNKKYKEEQQAELEKYHKKHINLF